ncbi:hypothetical protein [Microbacterium suwonense]|uniref:Uncharacterized protein n=1 Tax=Microbacterium suwonense TaxID=683047 RepID=A0ABM8FW75_9MICO|nr:hypothetical protein [Microbacterium suwonense]BDZ39875.1 hypothetical protein GCM10025863_24890 [Microbacterium suwonense]
MMDGLADALASISAGILLLRDDPHDDEAPPITEAPVDAVVLIGCSGRTRAALEIVRQRGLPVVVIEGDAGEGFRGSRWTTERPAPRSPVMYSIWGIRTSRRSPCPWMPSAVAARSHRSGWPRRPST